jgi:hypothetical protein
MMAVAATCKTTRSPSNDMMGCHGTSGTGAFSPGSFQTADNVHYVKYRRSRATEGAPRLLSRCHLPVNPSHLPSSWAICGFLSEVQPVSARFGRPAAAGSRRSASSRTPSASHILPERNSRVLFSMKLRETSVNPSCGPAIQSAGSSAVSRRWERPGRPTSAGWRVTAITAACTLAELPASGRRSGNRSRCWRAPGRLATRSRSCLRQGSTTTWVPAELWPA